MITKQSNAEKYTVLYQEAWEALEAAGKLITDPETGNPFYGEGFTHLEQYFTQIGDLAELHAANVAAAEQADAPYRNKEYKKYSKFLMLPLEEEYFIINGNTRGITVPANYQKNGVSVAGDQMAETLLFEVDRYFDFTDLTSTTIYVQWTNPAGEEGASKITMVDFDEAKIRFGWHLTDKITKPGNNKLTFSVRFFVKDISGEVVYSFNTTPTVVTIKNALYTNLNDAIMPDEPSNLFIKAIQNGSDSGSTIVPNTPNFLSEYPIPAKVYLKEDAADETPNGVVLKAQAYTGDAGILKYRWTHQPFGGETRIIKDLRVADHYELTSDTAFKANKRYYELKESGAYEIYPPNKEWKTGLYEAFTRYIIEDGTAVVAGNYTVEAVNQVGPNVSPAAKEFMIPAPLAIAIDTDLSANKNFLNAGELRLHVDARPDDTHAELSYAWMYKATETGDWAAAEGTNNESAYVAKARGWYKCIITSTMNRATYVQETVVAKVTETPVAPIIIDPDPSNMINNVYVANDGTATMAVTINSLHLSGVDHALTSEKVEYVWKRKYSDGREPEVIQAGALGIRSGVGTDTLVIDYAALPEAATYPPMFFCSVINHLNGSQSAPTNSETYMVVVNA